MFTYDKFPAKMLSSASVRGYVLNACKQTGKDVQNDFEATTRTWSHEVNWQTKYGFAGGEAYVSVRTDDWIWHTLNQGTNVRYSTMTPDFMAKTKVRQFSSWPGQGGVAYVDPSKPRPGIKARDWTPLAHQTYRYVFEQRIRSAMSRGMGL